MTRMTEELETLWGKFGLSKKDALKVAEFVLESQRDAKDMDVFLSCILSKTYVNPKERELSLVLLGRALCMNDVKIIINTLG